MILLFSLGYGFSFLSENLGQLGLDVIFESSTRCSYNIQRPEINIHNTSRRMPICHVLEWLITRDKES